MTHALYVIFPNNNEPHKAEVIIMNNKYKQTLVYIEEEVDEIFGDDENNEYTSYLSTPEMREKLRKIHIEEGFL